MSATIQALLVDDERLARDQLRRVLESCPGVMVVGEAHDLQSATRAVRTLDPDIVFLDIKLGSESGFDLLRGRDPAPRVVFVTAYDQHAIRAFEVNALDYLLKPVRKSRVETTLERFAGKIPREQPRPLAADDHLFVPLGGDSSFLKVADIAFIRAEAPYSRIYKRDGTSYLVLRPLRHWSERLPSNQFVRIHRSTIVNADCVRTITAHGLSAFAVWLLGFPNPLPMSRRCERGLRARL